MSELFPKTKVAIFKSDLRDIVDTLTKIAKGETPSVAIGYMSLKNMLSICKHLTELI